ncbi:putative copper chaperone CsoZ [Staphylococcus caeli]|uniref:putative copper chaperone CsoZ n=1 Tax=Staphylococcus caeli TaxID=2201815 RepID=UPI003F543CD3
MKSEIIYIAGIESETQKAQIEQHLHAFHGVQKVAVDILHGEIRIKFETPASLNNLEKEVYDLGYEILY